MISTVEDMYRYFLAGIKKEQTSIVPPATFDMLINEEQDKWLKEKFVTIEIDQKKIDDLQVLRVVTDGEFKYQQAVLNAIAPDVYEGRVFTLPVNPDQDINYDWSGIPPTAVTQRYPKYRRLLNVMFKIKLDEDEISEWRPAAILRSDNRAVIYSNPFRKPKDSQLYYEVMNDKIRLDSGGNVKGYKMRIEYLRYPRSISMGMAIDSEFMPEQQQEIVDRAVITYIERSKNTRYQTNLQEQMKNQINK